MDTFLSFAPALVALAGMVVLVALSVIDFRTWLLPDWLNALLAALGLLFHLSIGFSDIPALHMVYGSLLGAGILFAVRFFGNRHYKQDTLGLGDVKLMGAGGIWLGPEGIVMAITVGAFAGLVHGILVAVFRAIRDNSRPNLHRLMIPAGPGFCFGLLATAIWQFNGVLFNL